MPTTYTDQFWVIDPFAPPPVGTVLNVQVFDIIDNNNNNLVNRFSNDSIDGVDIRASYLGDTITVTLAGGGTVTITGVTFYLADGREVFTPTDGSLLTNATLVSTTFVTTQSSVTPTQLETAPCFTPGTLIETANGPKSVESLEAGDLILTADRGHLPLGLRHERHLSADHLQEFAKHRPIKIMANCLGKGLPSRDLTVSPQHRLMIRSTIAKRMFGVEEILVPAINLVGWPGISQIDVHEVTYIHLIFDHHAVIVANDVPTESLFLGPQMHESLGPRDINIIQSHFPNRQLPEMIPARLFVRGAKLRKLLERHQRNNRPLLQYGLMQAATDTTSLTA